MKNIVVDDITAVLLDLVTTHLAYRPECNNIDYIINISDSGEVSTNIGVMLYPNRYKRHETDKDSLLHHIAKQHIADFHYELTENGFIIDSFLVTPGKYVFSRPYNKKRRNWTKEE